MRQPTSNPNRLGLPGHHAPAVGFEVPLEMLVACHGRVQDQCETLRRLGVHLRQHGADLRARQAAAAVMRYFDTAARHHHADEEVDLFPALLESMAGADAVGLRELTTALMADHRELEHRWSELRRQLEQVAAGDAASLAGGAVTDFVDRYQRHIAREESELLPMAQRLLSDEELDRIGLAMRVRRNAVETPDASGTT